jgi:hypothetical protein
MKARGYRIVHVVPATPERPATPTEPQQWLLHPPSEVVAVSRWPKVPKFVFAGPPALPVPALSDLDWRNPDSLARAQRRGRAVPLPRTALWPRQITLPPSGMLAALPVPAASIFRIPDPAMLASPVRRIDTANARASEVSAKLAGKSRRPPTSAAQAAPKPEGAGATAPKPPDSRKNGRSVRVAGLKKR